MSINLIAGWHLWYQRWDLYFWSRASTGCWYLYAFQSVYLVVVQDFIIRYLNSWLNWLFHFNMLMDLHLSYLTLSQIETFKLVPTCPYFKWVFPFFFPCKNGNGGNQIGCSLIYSSSFIFVLWFTRNHFYWNYWVFVKNL